MTAHPRPRAPWIVGRTPLLEHAATEPHALPTNSELAALLGTVPELISRKLGEFYRLGLIELERRQVRVLDRAELERLAGRRGR